MNLRQVVPSGFGIVFLVVLISTIVSEISTNTLEDASYWVAHTYEVKEKLAELEKTLVDAETGQRGFIYSGNEEFLEPYNRATNQINNRLNNVAEAVSNIPQQLENLKEIEKLAAEDIEYLTTTIEYKKTGREEELRALVLSGTGRQIMDNIRANIKEMEEIENQLLDERYETAERASLFVRIVTWGSLVLIFIVGAITVVVINRIVIKPINEITNIIASSTTEIAATIQQQERMASEQANSVSITTTTMDELSSSSRQCSQQAQATVNAAQEALKVAEKGGFSVDETLEGMTQLKQRVGEIANQIIKFSQQTNQIGNISKMVSDLANQTNMLALNAAVEAVRAGEHGKGFSVVAGEIRKLAEQSRISAEQINGLVVEIQSLINSTVMVTDEGTKTVNWGMKVTENTTKAFEGITDSVNNVAANNQEIYLNTQQQAAAVLQVLEAMNSLERASQETAGGIGQTRVGVEQLKQAALQLKSIV
jgi:methyl-accepting chemotaxis protein